MTYRAEWLGPEAGCRTVLDYGCGSGVLALAALTLAADRTFTGHYYASTHTHTHTYTHTHRHRRTLYIYIYA